MPLGFIWISRPPYLVPITWGPATHTPLTHQESAFVRRCARPTGFLLIPMFFETSGFRYGPLIAMSQPGFQFWVMAGLRKGCLRCL